MHSRAATAIAALLCMGIWVYTIIDNGDAGVLSYLNLLLYLIFGLLISSSDERLSVGSQKTTFPTTLFFMSCAINPQLAPWQEATACLILMIAANHILTGTYRRHTAMGSYFIAFVLIGIASMSTPQLLYLIPALILCCGFMQSLHLRTAIASLLGVLTPYWIAFCILFLTDNIHLAKSFTEELSTGIIQEYDSLYIPYGEGGNLAIPIIAIQCLWTLLLVLPAIVHHILTSASKVKTRAVRYVQIGYISTLLIGTLILPSLYMTLQPTVVTLTATIGYGFFIAENKNYGRNIWLVILLVIWLSILGLYIWNNFLTI